MGQQGNWSNEQNENSSLNVFPFDFYLCCRRNLKNLIWNRLYDEIENRIYIYHGIYLGDLFEKLTVYKLNFDINSPVQLQNVFSPEDKKLFKTINNIMGGYKISILLF